MASGARSAWKALGSGSRRPVAALGAILTFGVPIVLYVQGHPWTPWWLVPPLLFISLCFFFAYHDLRVKYDAMASDRYELLEGQLRELDRVRLWLTLLEDPEEKVPLEDDRVFRWSKDTYELLMRRFPAESDAFMEKENAELGSPYFATTYSFEQKDLGRREYLESRAEIVRRICAGRVASEPLS